MERGSGTERTTTLVGALATSLGATVAIQLISVGTGVLLARSFNPEARGELAAILLWPMMIVVIATLGLFESASYFSARGRDAIGAIVGSSVVVALLQGALFCALTAALLPVVLHKYDSEVLHNANLMLPYIPIGVFTLTLMGVLNGRHRDAGFQAMRVLVIVTAAALLLFFAVTGDLSFQQVVWSYLGAQVVTAAASIYLVGREGVRPLQVRRDVAARVLRYGLLSHSGSVSAQLNQRLDLLVVSIFLTARDLGIYTIAFTLTTAVFVVGSSVAYVVLPRIAAAERARQATLARRTVSLTLLSSALIALPVLALMPELIRLFFGAAYLPATGVARILLIAAIALSTARALEAVLRGLGRPFEAGLAEIISLAVTVVGLSVLLPAIGLTGAAVASLIAYTVSVVVMLVRTRMALGIPMRSLLIPAREDLRLLAALLTGRSRSGERSKDRTPGA